MNSAMYEIELPTGLAPSQLNPLSLRNITGVPFVGITGGALPQGPQTTVPNAASIYDYLFEISWNSVGNASSHLQGLAVNVSCQPVPSVPIAVSLSSSSSNVSLSGTCPDGSSKNWTVPFSDGGMAVLNCPNTSESGVTGNQTLYIATLGSPGIVSVGNLTCQISGQIANGVMLQNTSGSSNTYTWEGDETVTASSLVPAFDVLRESIAGMTAALTLGQTNAGNLFVGTLQTVLLSSGGSFVWPGIDSESALVAKLVEAMLEGVISFEASLIRLVFALQQIKETYDLRGYGSLDYPFHPNPSIASTMVDERCFRDVQAFYFWNDIGWAGWDQHSHVLIAFLPIGLMGAVIPFLFVWVWRRRARGYNKTNLLSPVVLLARPSQRLREETLVDLEDPPSSHTILNFQRTRDGDRDWAGGFVLLNSSVRPSSPTSSIRSQIHDKDGYLQVDGEVD
ncbi:hypothetical protein SISNIDRAFT_106838 [Sistotremastrum niveocremeum HHB9708]|uniref:Uncharacterized protein n=1 Tax=Sistotremastrum niveocremeum HHB9708 TaxID=1314777 RepID=A0A164TX66_9AGAM|nr:hypothetical protein SISNIDRAFT_106838 [Sistotremastrum niveocremeum HHB9708]